MRRLKKTADEEARRMVEQAKVLINKEKTAAIAEVKSQVATLSLDIAEKILRKKFDNPAEQENLINEQLKTLHLN